MTVPPYSSLMSSKLNGTPQSTGVMCTGLSIKKINTLVTAYQNKKAMILGFRTHWPTDFPEHLAGKPTYFQEKIHECLLTFKEVEIASLDWGCFFGNNQLGKYIIGSKKPKIHTIRNDKGQRWKVKIKIHFYINVRAKNMFQFAPIIPCVSTQKIEIKYKDDDGFPWAEPKVFIDDIWFTSLEALAQNDGFDSLADFFRWFNKDYQGKIIHFTNYKY